MLHWCQSSFSVNLNLVRLLAKSSPSSRALSSPNSLSLPGRGGGSGALTKSQDAPVEHQSCCPSSGLWALGIKPCTHTHAHTCTHTHCCMVTRHHSSQESNGAETNKQGHVLITDMIEIDIIWGKNAHKITAFSNLILIWHNGPKGVLKAGNTLYYCTFYYCW